jgi:RNA polymerase sigma factor (sigma-70 family)
MDLTILPTEQIPDALLIGKILSGEKKLFELIIRRYNQRLYRIGMSILNDDAEVEEAMQVAYISAYEHLGQFENRSSFNTWITRILLNECLAQKKRRRRFSTERVTAEGEAAGRDPFEKGQSSQNSINMKTPANVLVNKELKAVLEEAVAQLPEKYRLVFVLREIEEMSVKETAGTLNIEEPNVKVRLNRAKTMLKDHLQGYMKDQVYNFHLTRCDRMVETVFGKLGLA